MFVCMRAYVYAKERVCVNCLESLLKIWQNQTEIIIINVNKQIEL